MLYRRGRQRVQLADKMWKKLVVEGSELSFNSQKLLNYTIFPLYFKLQNLRYKFYIFSFSAARFTFHGPYHVLLIMSRSFPNSDPWSS